MAYVVAFFLFFIVSGINELWLEDYNRSKAIGFGLL